MGPSEQGVVGGHVNKRAGYYPLPLDEDPLALVPVVPGGALFALAVDVSRKHPCFPVRVFTLFMPDERGSGINIRYECRVLGEDNYRPGRMEVEDNDVARRLVELLGVGQGKQSRLVLVQMRLLL